MEPNYEHVVGQETYGEYQDKTEDDLRDLSPRLCLLVYALSARDRVGGEHEVTRHQEVEGCDGTERNDVVYEQLGDDIGFTVPCGDGVREYEAHVYGFFRRYFECYDGSYDRS